MPTISMCMIVKNEASILGRCLDSYRGIFDEIIIVDTGSTDYTREVAQRYTDKIYDFKWIDDFAAARNYAFSLCTCDYIFSADADEILEPDSRAEFISLKNALIDEIDIVQMKYVNCNEFNSIYNSRTEYRAKLFRRLRTFTWISPIHETVRTAPLVFDSDIRILHMPENEHTKRDFDLFIKTINNGSRLENHALITFCKELLIAGDDDTIISVKELFEDKLLPVHTDYDCQKAIFCILAKIYRLTGSLHNFFKICLKEVADEPCSEICLELGEYYYSLKDYPEAILWFTNAAANTESILDIRTGGDKPLYRLSDCYAALADAAHKDNNTVLEQAHRSHQNDYRNQAKKWTIPYELM